MIDEDEKIKIRGFETVRRDWCEISRVTQNRIIKLILKEGNEKKALEYLLQTVEKLKSRKIQKKEIMIKSQIKKPLESYKSITPHVIAARKMIEKGIPVEILSPLRYYIAETNTKSKLIRDRVKLEGEPGEYDLNYYLEKQIIPSVENIFQVFGINVKEFLDGKKQESLKKWF